MSTSRTKRVLLGALIYGAIIVVTLFAVDAVCLALGLFPPTYNYGDAELGWRSASPTGHMTFGQCIEFSTGEVIHYSRNEDGVRTALSRDKIATDSSDVLIGATGDSQTDLCAPNSEIHPGVLEAQLKAHGIPAVVLTFGSGRYSPLQAYLAFRQVIRPYHPAVLVLNVYTGNDFYDMLRVDDRPHFVPSDSGYRIAGPVWYSLDDPKVKYRSRVLFALRSFSERTGVQSLYFRVSELRRLGAQQGGDLRDVMGYIWDLWRAREPSVGYSDAFAAQILNQQIFFQHFPRSEQESIQRMQALMRLIRDENPGMLLVMSPLPSYELTGQQPVDTALLKTLRRLPLSYEAGVHQEGELYERLRELAEEQGWTFVDNLASLKSFHGAERLYNDFDYHLLPLGSAIIGQAQATALLSSLQFTKR
jgi:hypothetical protein